MSALLSTALAQRPGEEIMNAVVGGVVAYGIALGVVIIARLSLLVVGYLPSASLISAIFLFSVLAAVGVQHLRLKVEAVGGAALGYRLARLYVSLSVPPAAFAACLMGGPHMLGVLFPYAATLVVIAWFGVYLLHRAHARLTSK